MTKIINSKKIPWFSPEMTGDEISILKKVIDSNFVNDGPLTREFEKAISEIINVKYCIAVTSCTAAISLALYAFDIGFGDEVIVPNLTFIATANAVRMTGASVKLADIESTRLTLDIESLKKLVTKKTKAIISVDVNGRGADYEKLENFCKLNNLKLITDSAEAFGSFYKGKALGSFGNAGCFSFSPAKTITTGQGGMIATNDYETYQNLIQLKDQGRPFRGTGGDDDHPFLGFNFKFTDLQAAVGLAQLEKLQERLDKSLERDNWYLSLLEKYDEINFPDMNEPGERRQWTDIKIKNRSVIKKNLEKNQIGCRAFWKPINSQPPYFNKNDNLKISESISELGLWLPSNFSLSYRDAEITSGIISDCLSKLSN